MPKATVCYASLWRFTLSTAALRDGFTRLQLQEPLLPAEDGDKFFDMFFANFDELCFTSQMFSCSKSFLYHFCFQIPKVCCHVPSLSLNGVLSIWAKFSSTTQACDIHLLGILLSIQGESKSRCSRLASSSFLFSIAIQYAWQFKGLQAQQIHWNSMACPMAKLVKTL